MIFDALGGGKNKIPKKSAFGLRAQDQELPRRHAIPTREHFHSIRPKQSSLYVALDHEDPFINLEVEAQNAPTRSSPKTIKSTLDLVCFD
jgi:hypothetical protein